MLRRSSRRVEWSHRCRRIRRCHSGLERHRAEDHGRGAVQSAARDAQPGDRPRGHVRCGELDRARVSPVCRQASRTRRGRRRRQPPSRPRTLRSCKLYPEQQPTLDAAYRTSIDLIPDSAGRTSGLRVGEARRSAPSDDARVGRCGGGDGAVYISGKQAG